MRKEALRAIEGRSSVTRPPHSREYLIQANRQVEWYLEWYLGSDTADGVLYAEWAAHIFRSYAERGGALDAGLADRLAWAAGVITSALEKSVRLEGPPA